MDEFLQGLEYDLAVATTILIPDLTQAKNLDMERSIGFYHNLGG